MCYTVCDIELDRTRSTRLSHTEVSPSGETSGAVACGGCDKEVDRMKGTRLSHTEVSPEGETSGVLIAVG